MGVYEGGGGIGGWGYMTGAVQEVDRRVYMRPGEVRLVTRELKQS